MKFLLSALVLATGARAFAQSLDEMNASIYLESKTSVNLYVPVAQADGSTVLKPAVTIPAESILALQNDRLARTLIAQRQTPSAVNYKYFADRSAKTAQPSKYGWYCGVEVTDVPVTELRESEVLQRQDFCVSLTVIRGMKALETNAEESLAAFNRWVETRESSQIASLAYGLAMMADARPRGAQPGRPAPEKRASPLKSVVVTSDFGYRVHPVTGVRRLHKGTDLRARVGTPVYSYSGGKVLAHRTERGANGRIRGYGHYAIVVHPKIGMQTLYAHLSRFVGRPGRNVSAGEQIAFSGNTGLGTGPHLHFETHVQQRRGYVPVNARTYLAPWLGRRVAELLEKVGIFFS